MEFKIFRIFIRSFNLFLILVLPNNIFSCGWSESYETSRLVLFRASLPSFQKLNKYVYSSDLYNETGAISSRDQKINSQEWIAKLGTNIAVSEVYDILYLTKSDVFQNAIESDSLQSKFKKNSFVATLALPKNKPFLDYISIAKQVQYNNEIDKTVLIMI